MIEQFKKAGEIVGAGISGGLAVNALFSLCNLPDRVIDTIQEIAQGNISGESLGELALTAYGLYSIKRTLKTVFGGETSSVIAITAGVFSALIAGSWGNEKAAWAGPIAGALASVGYHLLRNPPPAPFNRGDWVRRQLGNRAPVS